MDLVDVLETEKNLNNRDLIVEFESRLSNTDGAFFGDTENCPLKHSFSDGMYVREIFIPAGTVLTGKIHKHSHPNFLLSGEVEVFTEFEGLQRLKAPLSMISKAGTKRAVRAITDVVWVTVHSNPSDTQDLKQLESEIISPSFDALEHKQNKQIGEIL